MIYIENNENPLKITTTELNNTGFSSEAAEQAKMALNMRIAAHLHARLDLRGKTVFTFSDSLENFQPKSCKKSTCAEGCYYETGRTDCAFSLDKSKGIFTLGLHIADAEVYVSEGSPLDTEAKRRGITINTPKQHFPMMHENIYRGVCSFKEGEDRLAVSIFLKIDETGNLLDIRFEESVVRISNNCIFSEIDKLYSSSDSSCVLPLKEKYATLLYNMNEMYELGGILYSSRIAAGNFDYTNYKRIFSFDENGEAFSVDIKADYDSKLLTQEFLVFTAISLAKYFKKQGIPCFYLSQTLDREILLKMANIANIPFFDENIADEILFNEIFKSNKEMQASKPLYLFSSKMVQPAKYSVVPVTHWLFGTEVVGFSNPLDKYADLTVLRIMKALIRAQGEPRNLNITSIRKNIVEAVGIANKASRKANELLNNALDYCAKQIMEKNPQQEQPAYIINIDNNAIDVLLENGIKGKINSNSLKLVDKRSVMLDSERFEIGQHVKVVPDNTSLDSSENYFTLVR